MQAQWPRRFDAVEVNEGALLQHREVAGLADLTDHPPQDRAPLGRRAIAAQHVEGKARQALTDDIGAAAGLAGEKARLLEQRERPVQRGLGQLGRLHELRESDGPARAHQHLQHSEGLERRGGFARDFCGLDRE